MEEFSFKNKTVVFLIKIAALGGAERQALGLADYLIREYNCNVYLVATHSNEMTDEFRQFASECGIINIEYFGTPSLTINKGFSIQNLKKTIRALKYIYKIKNEISKYRPDIIIPFSNTPSKLSALIYKATGAKITFWHQLGLDTYSYDLIEKIAVKRTKYFIANAVNGLAVFREKYKVPENKLFLLPQYVSLKIIDYDQISLRKEFSIKDDAIVIGMIAHYREEKHHELLIEAFHEICHLDNVHLVLLGNKENDADTLAKYNNLNSKIHSLGIENKVSLLSQVSVEKILNLIDIGVLVSEYEGVPTVIMEYMFYQKPIIATNHIGCKNLLGDSQFLIPKNDVEELSLKLMELYKNENLRITEGLKNKKNIKKFSIENYCNSLQLIFSN